MFKLMRRGSARVAVVSVIFLTILACIYYTNYTNSIGPTQSSGSKGSDESLSLKLVEVKPRETVSDSVLRRIAVRDWIEQDSSVSPNVCPLLWSSQTDVDTVARFKTFDFQPYWMKSKEYWDTHFEERYKDRKEKWSKLPLKVILVPHSHNDPGWLKTYESYFHYHSRNILNNMAEKLKVLPNMTFIWSEISFFAQWWESAHPNKKHTVKKLLDEGRLEITTGGWVMTDEATTHIYGMLDQLIEGHQWVKNNLNLAPQTGWSIDPFGHGSTVPYLLKASGLSGGTVIQRIHYAWKQWLAEWQIGDFMWRQNWDQDGHTDILTHNQPFDIYSIKHSCGPHPQVCLNFDFRKIPGEYTEYSIKAVPIDDVNLKQKAELLLNQYGRTGSLFPHNVVLMPLGDDFRYEHDIEWDQQYRNYKKLFDYINKNKDKYNAELVFGTPFDYFKEVKERMKNFKTLKGDFFVYSDIFSEGRPAYWSGYYTTRPYWKILDRELESNLRSAEILYTFALNRAKQTGFNNTVKLLERDYEKLTRSRKNLGLFQHHDAITGTSKSFVMHDYALKLFESLQDSIQIQSYSMQTLLMKDASRFKMEERHLNHPPTASWLLPDTERESYERLAKKVPITISKSSRRTVVVFNSLGQQRQDIVTVQITDPNVRVLDVDNNIIPFQINPVWNLTSNLDKINQNYPPNKDKILENELKIVEGVYELMFIADLPGLSLATYTIEYSRNQNLESRAIVYCSNCGKNNEKSPFELKNIQPGDVQLENHRMKLLIDGRSGFLKAVTKKSTGVVTQCGLQFAAYPSAQFHSGAYLFMPDPHSRDPEHEVLDDDMQQVVITSGPIASQLNVVYGKMLNHFVRIYHANGPLSEGIYIENVIDFEAPPKNRETELFMRVVSDISNGDPPEFYSDLNGFHMQKRVKVERIGIEGNYYPITTMAYIEDNKRRLSLLVNHAQGASAWQPGLLEVMLDRRTLYDDSRGMGEGVVDNKKTLTKFWLLLEEITQKDADATAEVFTRPSLYAQHMSNSLLYPANVFVVEKINDADDKKSSPSDEVILNKRINFLTRPLPCDVHLLNVRTLSDNSQFPSASCLMIFHKQGYSCEVSVGITVPKCGLVPPVSNQDGGLSAPLFYKRTLLNDLKVSSIAHTSLTGLHHIKRYDNFDDIVITPMDLLTLNVSFST